MPFARLGCALPIRQTPVLHQALLAPLPEPSLEIGGGRHWVEESQHLELVVRYLASSSKEGFNF